MTYTSLYAILDLTPHATQADIKAAYRRLALQYHPDRNVGEESDTRFILINNAYEVLYDIEKRREYDRYLSHSSAGKYAEAKPDAARAIAGARQTSRETLFSHLNFLLWDIEDILRESNIPAWNIVQQYVLKMLLFIDRWVLFPGGYPDYFMMARRKGAVDSAEYFKAGFGAHRPFVSLNDYFFDIRKRMDKFLSHARESDLTGAIEGSDIRLIDGVLETINFSVHYLAGINMVVSGEADRVEDFVHSAKCFES